MNPTYHFLDQVAVVTGAGGGMGLGTAQAFDRVGRLDLAFNNAGIRLPLSDAAD